MREILEKSARRRNMIRSRSIIVLVSIGVLAAQGAVVRAQPQSVPRKVNRQLDEASYVALAKEWKQYIEKYGETADALVNLGLAYDYSGETEAAVMAFKRAVEVGPKNPSALANYGDLLASYVGDVPGAIELLERCRAIAPDYGFGLTVLATAYMRLGELAKADKVFETMFKERVIPQPLQDYGYNMLIGLPQSSVLITWGDNDTYPLLVLQAGMQFRKDVAVICMSMLTLVEYDEALFKRYAGMRPAGPLEPDESQLLYKTLIKRIVREHKVPIFFTSGINFDRVGFEPDVSVEGMNLRVTGGGGGLSAEESARLFLDTYRMDSATDWNFPWSLETSVAEMMMNYVSAMARISERDGIKEETRKQLLQRALAIADYHDFERGSQYIRRLLRNK
jgi:tetratricopeptide (TPR) repeat protein